MPGAAETTRKFLVTGATGFIGSRLVAALVERHGVDAVTAMVHTRHSARDVLSLQALQARGVAILECDLLELPERAPARPEFDVVYHLAAFAETETPSDESRVNSD